MTITLTDKGVFDEIATPSTPAAGDVALYAKGNSIFKLGATGAEVDLGAAGGGTLDQSYDFGGVGVGRTITADSGPVSINGTGGFTVGNNALVGSELVSIQRNQAAPTRLDVRNLQVGAGGAARVFCIGDNESMFMDAEDGGITALIHQTGVFGMIFGTNSSSPIIGRTGGFERWRVLSSGEWGIGQPNAATPGIQLRIKRDFNSSTTMQVANTIDSTSAAGVYSLFIAGISAAFNLTAPLFTPTGFFKAGTMHVFAGADLRFGSNVSGKTVSLATFNKDRVQIDDNETAAETAMLISEAGGAVKRVSVGAVDSGGTGFKLLRVAN